MSNSLPACKPCHGAQELFGNVVVRGAGLRHCFGGSSLTANPHPQQVRNYTPWPVPRANPVPEKDLKVEGRAINCAPPPATSTGVFDPLQNGYYPRTLRQLASCRGRRLDRSWKSRRSVACTSAANGALRNRGQHGPAVPLPGKLQPASRKAGTCPFGGLTSPRTSRTRDRGTERRAETAVFGWLFLRRSTSIAFWRRTGFNHAEKTLHSKSWLARKLLARLESTVRGAILRR